MDERLFAVAVELRQADERHSTQVEIAAVALADQVETVHDFGAAETPNSIVDRKQAIAEQRSVPTPQPALVDLEFTGAFQRAAEIAHAHGISARPEIERAFVELKNARGPHLIGAGHQSLSPLALHQRTLQAEWSDRHRSVVVRRQRPEVGDIDSKPGLGGAADGRQEEAGLARDGRVGMRKERHPGEGDSEKLKPRILVVDHPLAFIVDDAGRADLPERRPLGVLLAEFAGRVDAAAKDGGFPLQTVGARRGEAGLVRALDEHRIDEAVTEIVGDLQHLGMDHAAVARAVAYIAFGVDPVGLAIVGDLARLEHASLVVDLYVADGRHEAFLIIVGHLVGLDEQARVRIGAARAEDHLRRRRLCRRRVLRKRRRQPRRPKQCTRDRRKAPVEEPRRATRTRDPGMDGTRYHQPSS